jgi:DNA replication protein DnaC
MPSRKPATQKPDSPLYDRITRLGLWGLAARWDEVGSKDWLPTLLEIEEKERQKRSLDTRVQSAHIGRFKDMGKFDWEWPKKIDRPLIEDLFNLEFLQDGGNVILVGANGLGKTMIAKNLVHQAVIKGYTARFVTASDLLNDLAAQDGSRALQRCIRRYCRPQLLAVDELGYLSYDNRHADLLFEVVTRRYGSRSTLVTTNKPFAEWSEVFPNATCVVTLVDRLVHRSEIVPIEGDSYRAKEAKELAAERARLRAARRKERRAADKEGRRAA